MTYSFPCAQILFLSNILSNRSTEILRENLLKACGLLNPQFFKKKDARNNNLDYFRKIYIFFDIRSRQEKQYI